MPDLASDIDAIVQAVGVEDVGLVWGLANQNWKSAQDRDAFLEALQTMKVSTLG